MLAREPMQTRTLVKHHKGTASATGEGIVDAVRIDSLEIIRSRNVDLLKIDVDGFDGEVIAGAKEILTANNPPTIIFEWHPQLCHNTGNDMFRGIDTLVECGYQQFAWFGNLGNFSHFSGPVPKEILKEHASYLLDVNVRSDEHFDVVALPPNSSLSLRELANLNHARKYLGLH